MHVLAQRGWKSTTWPFSFLQRKQKHRVTFGTYAGVQKAWAVCEYISNVPVTGWRLHESANETGS